AISLARSHHRLRAELHTSTMERETAVYCGVLRSRELPLWPAGKGRSWLARMAGRIAFASVWSGNHSTRKPQIIVLKRQIFASGRQIAVLKSRIFASGRQITVLKSRIFASGRQIIVLKSRIFASGRQIIVFPTQTFASARQIIVFPTQTFASGRQIIVS